MSDPLQNAADGFANRSWDVGHFVDEVINKKSPALWGGPYYSIPPSEIRWALMTAHTFSKTSLSPPQEAEPSVIIVVHGGLGDISYWEFDFPEVDPKVMKIQNTLLLDFGVYTGNDATALSLSVEWGVGHYIWAWGRLDEDVVIRQYDTPIIGVNKANIGITYWTP